MGAFEVGQKKSASPQTPGTSADHKRLLMVDASATNRCTCEEDCLDGCDICEKELHKKKMQRGTISSFAVTTTSTEKAGVMSHAVATSSSALAQHAMEKDVSALFV